MVAKAMLLTSNRGFAECGEVFGAAVVAIPASPPRYRHPKLFRYVQNYSLDLRGINLANQQGCYATLGGSTTPFRGSVG